MWILVICIGINIDKWNSFLMWVEEKFGFGDENIIIVIVVLIYGCIGIILENRVKAFFSKILNGGK
jgi:hypothetical protein